MLCCYTLSRNILDKNQFPEKGKVMVMTRGKNDNNMDKGDKALDYLENIRSIIHQGREQGFISVQDIEKHIPI